MNDLPLDEISDEVPVTVSEAMKSARDIIDRPKPYFEPAHDYRSHRRDWFWIITIMSLIVSGILALIMLTVLRGQSTQNIVTQEDKAQRACRDAYSAQITRLSNARDGTQTELQAAFSEALRAASQQLPIDGEGLDQAVANARAASIAATAAIQLRDNWDLSGQPFKPCPIDPAGNSG